MRLLQIGACDGVNFDPINKFLQQAPESSGVFVEPLAEYIAELAELKATLSSVSILNLAVSDHDGVATIRYVDPEAIRTGVVPKWAMGISTITPGRNAIDGEMIDPEVFLAIQAHTLSRSVPVFSTQRLMRIPACQNSNVYLSDCEGHDATILLDLDMDIYRPNIFFLESMLMTEVELGEVLSKFARFDYSVVNDGTDMLATLRS